MFWIIIIKHMKGYTPSSDLVLVGTMRVNSEVLLVPKYSCERSNTCYRYQTTINALQIGSNKIPRLKSTFFCEEFSPLMFQRAEIFHGFSVLD